MASACLLALARYRTARTLADRSRGYFLGRALVKAGADRRAAVEGKRTGRLGRALCGFDDPFNPLRSALDYAISVRIANINEALDDGWQFTLSGPVESYVMDWDGGPFNDTTYGPFIGPPGDWSLSGSITQENENGNYFLVEISVAGLGVVASSEDSDGSLINFTV